MVYRIRHVRLTNDAEVVVVGKRCIKFQTPQTLNVGGLYFLKATAQRRLYRVEEDISHNYGGGGEDDA